MQKSLGTPKLVHREIQALLKLCGVMPDSSSFVRSNATVSARRYVANRATVVPCEHKSRYVPDLVPALLVAQLF
jgi:hypothetical protein